MTPMTVGEFAYRVAIPCFRAYAPRSVRLGFPEKLTGEVLPRLGERKLVDAAESGAFPGCSEEGAKALASVFMLARTLGYLGPAEGEDPRAPRKAKGGTVRKKAAQKDDVLLDGAKTLNIEGIEMGLPYALTEGELN